MIYEYDFMRCDYSVEYTEKYLHTSVSDVYSQADSPRIFEAFETAYQAHAKQLRDNDAPYIIHPMRVALMLIRYEGAIADVFIAALLHDTLEDTSLSSREIEQKFGTNVSKLVKALTRQHGDESLQEKQLAKFQKWQRIMNNIHEIRAIKTFDALDNMMCWKSIPQEKIARKKIPRWLKEAKEMSLPLARATNIHAYNLMQELYAMVYPKVRLTLTLCEKSDRMKEIRFNSSKDRIFHKSQYVDSIIVDSFFPFCC